MYTSLYVHFYFLRFDSDRRGTWIFCSAICISESAQEKEGQRIYVSFCRCKGIHRHPICKYWIFIQFIDDVGWIFMQICWHPMTMWSYTCDMPQYAVKPRFIHNICSIICYYTVSRYWYFKVSITSFFISLMVSSVNRGYHEFWCHKMFSIVNVFHYSDVYSVANISKPFVWYAFIYANNKTLL